MSEVLVESTAVTAPPIRHGDQGRLESLDAARLLATLAIVWLHSVQSPQLQWTLDFLCFGTPFYTYAAVLFSMEGLRRSPQRSFGAYAASRARRVYVPFLLWGLAYLLLRNAERVMTGRELLWPTPLMLLMGASYHLWFLPFVLLVCLVAYGVTRLTLARPSSVFALVPGCGMLALLPVLWPLELLPDSEAAYVHRVWLAVPGACGALAFGAIYPRIRHLVRESGLCTAAGLVLLVASMAASSLHVIPQSVARPLGGLGLLLAALSVSSARKLPLVASLGRHTFSLYLLHVAVLEILRTAGTRIGVAGVNQDVLVFLGTSVICVAAVGFYSRCFDPLPRARFGTSSAS